MTNKAERTPSPGRASIRGARENNLRSVDLDVPYRQITSFCGLSGSGKSSLAFDVIYAEGRRRYLESLSRDARRHFEMLDKPDVESIEGLPPSVAVVSQAANPSAIATVGTATEASDYLQFLFAKLGVPRCQRCGKRIRRYSPDSTLEIVDRFPSGTRVMIAFAPSLESVNAGWTSFKREWLEKGFYRAIARDETLDLRDESAFTSRHFNFVQFLYNAMADFSDEDELGALGLRSSANERDDASEEDDDELSELKTKSRVLMLDQDGDDGSLMRYLKKRDAIRANPGIPPIFFAVDRATIGQTDERRLLDSIETAFANGNDRCWIFVEGERSLEDVDDAGERISIPGRPQTIGGAAWTLFGFGRKLRCEECGVDFPEVEPNLFNFASPRGACPVCLGLGRWTAFDMDRVFPNKSLSIAEGAIAPWTVAAYRSKLKEFLGLADKLGVRTDVPFGKLTRKEVGLVLNGSSQFDYKGLNGFLWSLLEQKYKMHIRAFLARWQTWRVCPACQGSRLRRDALAVKIEGKDFHDLCSMPVSETLRTIDSWKLDANREQIGRFALSQLRSRLAFLEKVGLGHLTLERPVKTLSSGENGRVKLTTALGSDLVDSLYILDEPSDGLHPQDSEKLLQAIRDLRDRGNAVIVVDHDPVILEGSDKIVELGPGAGRDGGQIVFEGTVEQIKANPDSLTGSYLSGRRRGGGRTERREPSKGFIELLGASGRNLKNIDANFPLGCFCVVTGVSGAGKTTLIRDTLYPALCSKIVGDKNVDESALPYDKIIGTEDIDEVAFVDRTPIGRSPRSNPASYLKIFDDIRNLYAETPEAKARGYGAGYFSFNVDGGRCDACKGEGVIRTPMQFVADVYARCPFCGGKRYQRSVLDVTYRDRNIADALDMTAREAFGFFRGQPKIQQKIKRMLDVGLDYLQLGRPVNTLSGGEAQRLKLAGFLSTARKGACLFIMDEPTVGLHFADVVKLLDVFNELVDSGNSIVAVEHNPLAIKAADHIIDLGPGAADQGGAIVAEGTPEEVAKNKDSATGRVLAKILKRPE
ncbi:MAG: excinuclease ABC subunit UvrA [Thermoguttaceae bacterium]|nr:excinuclease ABC subunit UvrA [Thermoguttaceae bacterium]